MILIAQIRLTEHFLGELKPDQEGVRRFRRDREGRVLLNQSYWLEQLCVASRSLRLPALDIPQTVIPPTAMLPASIHLKRRVFSGRYTELFESFRKGTILTFEMQLHTEKEHCPTSGQLQILLQYVGSHLGISPFGSKFGLGRFDCLSLKTVLSL